MVLRGSAFMIMWHDIAPEGEAEYHHWHTKQHMPERLGHRGFNRSRRGVHWGYDRHRYFTLYEGDELQTFQSEDYLRSLNGPTEWTSSMAPHFRNFLRCACEVHDSRGRGMGGALATFRGRLPAGMAEADFSTAIRQYLDALFAQPLVCGTHLAFARPAFSNQATKETELRPAMAEGDFDFVLVVESYGLPEIEGLAPGIAAELTSLGAGELVSECYDVAYAIDKD